MKKLIIKIGNKTHELPYNGEVFSFEVSDKYDHKVGDCVMTNWGEPRCTTFFKIVSIDNDGDLRAESSVDLDKGKYTIYLDELLFLYETNFIQITPEELKAKYAEAGYDWDYETNEAKPLKWMPKDGDEVWYSNLFCKPVNKTFDIFDTLQQLMAEKGLLFPTEAECQKFADHCLKYFDKK
mgnify:FL=1